MKNVVHMVHEKILWEAARLFLCVLHYLTQEPSRLTSRFVTDVPLLNGVH